jgi:hypothetical protein
MYSQKMNTWCMLDVYFGVCFSAVDVCYVYFELIQLQIVYLIYKEKLYIHTPFGTIHCIHHILQSIHQTIHKPYIKTYIRLCC